MPARRLLDRRRRFGRQARTERKHRLLLQAFGFQWGYNSQRQPSFLNGTFYPEAYRYYFPLVLLMKVPLPVFALALLGLVRIRSGANPLALTAALMLAPLLLANVQLGVRLTF